MENVSPSPPSTKPSDHSSEVPRRRGLRELDAVLAPKTVAVIGATENQGVARLILSNLVSYPFGGTVYPIHPRERSLLGVKAYRAIAAAPEPIDLAAIASPAENVPAIIEECVEAQVKGAIVLSPGFRETGAAGEALESQILDKIGHSTLRIIGPNCLGVINTSNGLNASIARVMPGRGHVAFVSQSGAIGTAVLDWSLRENVGLSVFISVGSMLDVGWGELIYYLADDPQTRSILLYIESVDDARQFLSAVREVALVKPIILLKAGRTEGARRAASLHTGAMFGSDAVLDAAVRRVGALRVNSLSDLFHIADVLDKQPRPLGPRLTVITNAGGPGVLAADALTANGGELAPLGEETVRALDDLLPAHWSHTNPIDLLGDADPARYLRAIEIATADKNTNGFLVILAPQACSNPTQTAEKLKPFGSGLGKPLLASWMGAKEVERAEAVLSRARIPTFAYPDTAARMFDYMWRYTYNLRGHYETPTLPSDSEGATDRLRADQLIQAARQAGRTLLTEFESKQVLAAYHLPVVPTRLATSEDEAARCADELGYPVVLKIHSGTILNKVEIGGVVLDINDASAVHAAFRSIRERCNGFFQGVTVQPMINAQGYELGVGSSIDPQFGPVLLFGLGGRLTDVFQDRALGLPLEKLPRPAIRPYPSRYVSSWETRQGLKVSIRPIRPEDEPQMVKFHGTLSDESVFMRYMHILSLSQRVSHERLARVCFNDYDRELALVVERPDSNEIIAVGRLSKMRRTNDAEFAILVSDQNQGHGIGTELLGRLVQIGRDEKMDHVIGFIAGENTAMLRVCQRLRFRVHREAQDSDVEAIIDL